MDTLRTDYNNDYQMRANLFQKVFLLQLQLENWNYESSDYYEEINGIIQSIDQLMEALLKLSDSKEQQFNN